MNTLYRKNNGSERGFTIIEVVLVLAIAGLIFLMVFIALPALQRSQRDTQRRDDLSKIQTQIESYKSNSRGNIPATLNTVPAGATSSFAQAYLKGGVATAGSEYQDPSTGSGYSLIAVNTLPTAVGQVGYYPARICPTDGSGTPTTTGAVARNYSLVVFLEGQTVPYCSDSR